MLFQLLLCTLAKGFRDEQAHGCCTLFRCSKVPSYDCLEEPFQAGVIISPFQLPRFTTAVRTIFLSNMQSPVFQSGLLSQLTSFAVNTSGENNCATVTPGQTDFMISQSLQKLVTVVLLANSVR